MSHIRYTIISIDIVCMKFNDIIIYMEFEPSFRHLYNIKLRGVKNN